MASLQQERDALRRAIEAVPPELLPTLRQIVEVFAEALAQERERERGAPQRALDQEMAAWDAASDEALAGFENRLATAP